MFKIHRLDSVESTNSLARNYGYGNVIVASIQTKGKGRFSRDWNSPKGGLWFSIVVKPERRDFEYTFIASLAVLSALGVGEIKWPNDIVCSNKKLCGILSELISEGNKCKIIVGIGINVNNRIPKDLKEKAISLSEIKGKKVNLDSLLNKIIKKFEELSKVDFKRILIDYKKNCSTLGKNINVKTLKGEISGKAIDIEHDGNLILEVKGKRVKLYEGDVSIL